MESKALSTEIQILFDTIEKQSVKYKQAFMHLDERIKDFDILYNQLNNVLSSYKDKTINAIYNFNETTEERLNYLHSEINDVIIKVQKFRNIDDLQKEHSLLVNTLSELSNELQNEMYVLKNLKIELSDFFETYKRKTAQHLDLAVDEAKITIDKLVKNETKKAEQTLNYQMRFLDGRVLDNSQGVNQLQKELTYLNQKNDENLKVYEDKFKEFEKKLKDKLAEMRSSEEEMSIKLNLLESAFTAFRDEITAGFDEFKNKKQYEDNILNPEKSLKTLLQRTHNLEEQFENLNKKNIGLIIIAVFAILFALIALFV